MITEAKRALRATMRQRLAQLDPDRRAEESERLCRRLEDTARWRIAETVLGFVPLPSEPDIWSALLAARRLGRAVYLPRWNAAAGLYQPALLPEHGRLATGPFGVPEPDAAAAGLEIEQLDLILVPALAFDRFGRRLGRGRGFYDRLLAQASRARKWGVGFDLQIVAEVPAEPHDVMLDLVVTPDRWVPHPAN